MGGRRRRRRAVVTSRSARARLGARDDGARGAVTTRRGRGAGRPAHPRRFAATGSGERRRRRAARKPRARVDGAEPFAADPERRALVAQERSEPAGARPAPAAVAPERHRAGAGEEEDAGRIAERAAIGGLRVRDDPHVAREGPEPPRLTRALRARPHAARGHDEDVDVRSRQRPSLPEPAEERGEPGKAGARGP